MGCLRLSVTFELVPKEPLVGLSQPRAIEEQPSTRELTAQRRHRFQMPFVVSGEAQHKMSGAGPCIALQPFCQAAVQTGIASLPATHHGSGLAIILFEISVEPKSACSSVWGCIEVIIASAAFSVASSS